MLMGAVRPSITVVSAFLARYTNFVVKMMNFLLKMMNFCTEYDEFCIEYDGFCISNDESRKVVRHSRSATPSWLS